MSQFANGIRRLTFLTGVGSGGVIASEFSRAEVSERPPAVQRMPSAMLVESNLDAENNAMMDSLKNTTGSDFSASMDTLHNTPEILFALIPNVDTSSIAKRAGNLLNRPDFRDAVQRNFAEAVKKMENAKVVTASADDISADGMWQQLQREYPCVLCQDVLAAPVLFHECSHSFCGTCAEDHLTRCMPFDPNNDGHVIVACPTCRTEVISSPTFERMFDERIMEAVMAVPACADKEEHDKRRTAYKELMKARAAAQQEAKAKTHSQSQPQSNASYLRGVFSPESLHIDFRDLDDDVPIVEGSVSFENWVSIVTVAVIVVLTAVLKYRADKK